jgi:inactivated superfamily I helicase
MNLLHIYPTARAIRRVTNRLLEEDRFLPSMMRMDEFEQRAVLLEGRRRIDPMKRMLLLREAAAFESFERLHFQRDMVRFFTKSEDLFKFYEELSAEDVDFGMLAEADAYAEFGTHLEILESLLSRYEALLDKAGLTDRALIPKHYTVNEAFLSNYKEIVIHLEGYLSRFELTLLMQICRIVPVKIRYHTSRFNIKMQERFAEHGIVLPKDACVLFDLAQKSVLEQRPCSRMIKCEVLQTEERQAQIALAFAKIEAMVQRGIDPEQIVLILPDESLKEQIALYDTHGNLNFAMGYDYTNKRTYKQLNALYRYWQSGDKESIVLLERYGMEMKKIGAFSPNQSLSVVDFFAILETLAVFEDGNEQVSERMYHFQTIFAKEQLPAKVWLFLWLKVLSTVTIDDVRGGKVTVMGVLETRGVSFEGVVIVDFNEGIVPATSGKDRFLNTQVRAFAKLPTRRDRESLQKQYYKRLLEEASESVIIYSSSENKLPSKFI